jgi:hypothetical protein
VVLLFKPRRRYDRYNRSVALQSIAPTTRIPRILNRWAPVAEPAEEAGAPLTRRLEGELRPGDARRPDGPEHPILMGPVEYWHLLSLDAPTVAVLWAFAFARVFHTGLPWATLAILFAGTWLLYVADRILDGLRLGRGPARSAAIARLRDRHFFYIRHRTAVLGVAIPVAAIVIWLVCTRMTPAVRMADAVIFAVACNYFCLVHLPHGGSEWRFPKELMVALVFAAATVVPAWTRLGRHHRALILLAALFAALCWLNCMAIEKWEQDSDSPTMDATTRWGQKNLHSISAAVGASAILIAGYFLCVGNIPVAGLCLAMALSADLFLVLDRSRLSKFHLRIAADAALLTPLILLLIH